MIEGHIAMWAVRQSPYHCPEGLREVLLEFRARITRDGLNFDSNEMAQLSFRNVKALLNFHLLPIPKFQAWNKRKNGNPAPYGFCSRYGKPEPDNDFIDLDALTGNVARSVIEECRKDYESDHPCYSLWQKLRFKWLLRKAPMPHTADA